MIGFLFFVLLLAFFIIVMYRLFTISSEGRSVVLKTMTSGSAPEGDTTSPEEDEETDKASLRSNFLRSNILGSDMLKRSMWFGFGRSNKKSDTIPNSDTNTSDTTKSDTPKSNKKDEKVGVKGGFGDVVTKKEDDTNKGKESGTPTKEVSKEFEKEVDPKPVEFEAVTVSEGKLELKPKDLSTARDNTKEDKKDDEDKINEEEKKIEEAKIKSVLGEGAISPLESPINKSIKREKLIPKISLHDNQLMDNNLHDNKLMDNKLQDNKLMDNKLIEKKSSHHHNKSDHHKSNHLKSRKDKSEHHKSRKNKSDHHKSDLKGRNIDLNTLLVSTKEAELQ